MMELSFPKVGFGGQKVAQLLHSQHSPNTRPLTHATLIPNCTQVAKSGHARNVEDVLQDRGIGNQNAEPKSHPNTSRKCYSRTHSSNIMTPLNVDHIQMCTTCLPLGATQPSFWESRMAQRVESLSLSRSRTAVTNTDTRAHANIHALHNSQVVEIAPALRKTEEYIMQEAKALRTMRNSQADPRFSLSVCVCV